MLIITACLVLIFSTVSQEQQEAWELAKSKDGIRVYVTRVTGSRYYAFKSVMEVQSTESEIVRVLMDVRNYPEWFAFTASSKLIEQTATGQTFLMETDYPWPFSNECMIYKMQFIQGQGDKYKITIAETDATADCKYSLKKARGFILLESDKGITRITYYFHSEPSQNIPPWLINPKIHEMPYLTFQALKKQLR